ncbi:Chemotaxis protein CheV [Fundidesulfovibrio magnetotacticus]|uniref:Chemotaxis protein CheV n=1 Tax=Fundidesulfovibrio magnetotacticus TaxID=2730080 RepID=A0A6V8LSR9_9BACT|nr:chemotaxis protein CheW [Fundidesulfovibrio magnetotacticus]GFK95523.1 Chemotaxis protein CheV [Fundidesulfovibrio magnetotacticus]
MKTLEDYFAQSVALPDQEGPKDLNGVEREFLEKYVGMGWENTPQGKALAVPVQAEQVMAPPPDRQDVPEGDDLESSLMAEEELRLVSFHVQSEVFAVPIMLVQEVLRAVPATKLPAAPPHLAGVTNLRGKVTPLVDLACLLGLRAEGGQPDNFLIVCRLHGMQIGLLVRAIDTMYRAPRADIEWGIESQLGVSAGLMAGLYKSGDRLIQILSISRLFQKVLKS